jgi:hypothetical protein
MADYRARRLHGFRNPSLCSRSCIDVVERWTTLFEAN